MLSGFSIPLFYILKHSYKDILGVQLALFSCMLTSLVM